MCGYKRYKWGTGDFYTLDFGLAEFGVKNEKERLRIYRKFVYETGAVEKGKGVQISEDILEKEEKLRTVTG